MNIHEGWGKQRWCGPMAVSIIVGCSSDKAAEIMRQASGRRMITRTHIHELEKALSVFGLTTRIHAEFCYLSVGKRPTIAKWLSAAKAYRTAGRVYLVIAGNHWQVVSGRRFACSLTKGEIVSIRDKRVGRRRRVKTVWEIVKA